METSVIPPDRVLGKPCPASIAQNAVRRNLRDSGVENECSGFLSFVSCFLPSKSGIAFRNQSNLQELEETVARKPRLSGTWRAAFETKETL